MPINNEAAAVSEHGATLKCAWCGIFIGEGHQDQTPVRAPDGETPLCSSCSQAALRRNRREAEGARDA